MELPKEPLDDLLDVMQVLVLTDLELSFWPPCCDQEEARWALRGLAASARRRGVLAAQRLDLQIEPALCGLRCPQVLLEAYEGAQSF